MPRFARVRRGLAVTTAWVRRRALGMAMLAALGAASAGLVGLGSHVDVLVDGEVATVRTYGSTVGDVVDQLELDVGSNDAVRPGLDDPVIDGMLIDVVRAVTVDVHVDGALVHRVVAPVDSVAGVLHRAGLADVRSLDAQVVPAWTAPVSDGARVDVWVPHQIQLSVDGQTRAVTTFDGDVESLLLEEGVELGEHDLLSHPLETPLGDVRRVVVERVAFGEVVEEVVLPHGEVRTPSDEVWLGTTKVAVEGEDGLRYDRYRVTTIDAEEVDRELVAQEVARAPQPREVLVGTHVDWDRLARCEAGGNWQRDGHTHLDEHSDARYYGGLQFNHRSWRVAGGTTFADWPHEATREEQIATA
ncbi:MAG: ubiquitin-like domain-containing protein, partial [Nitriliruptoraceae bacterium]